MTPTTLQLHKIRVYLSSPGDVAEERTLARAVLGILQKDPSFADRVFIEEVSWDDPENPVPLDASQNPQQSINRARGEPADCDVVLVILWSRLGTRMPANIRKPDGSSYRSGTEWEFGNALAGARKTGRPAVWLYRRDAEFLISSEDPEGKAKLDQAHAAKAFFKGLVNPDGSLPHGYNTYTRPEEFRWLFESHLRQWLSQHLSKLGAAWPAQEQEAGAQSTVPKGDDAGNPATETRAWSISLVDGINRLVLLIAVAGLFGITRGDVGLPGPLQWSIAAVLLGIIGVNFVREWRTFQDRRQTRRLALTTVAPRVGYFRIGPYEDRPEDRQDFKRADRAHEQVLEWLESAKALPLYLSGDSGSGKSSLLNASVLPALREKRWTVVTARAYQDPEAALRNALTTAHPGLALDGMSLRDLAAAVARQADGPLLLLLDQFEECLILASAEVQAGFRAWVADLAARPIGNLKLLLALRTEYLTDLEQAGFPPHAHKRTSGTSCALACVA